MDKREAKRDACSIVNRLLDSYRCVGQPWCDHLEKVEAGEVELNTKTLDDLNRLDVALCELQNEMFQRARGGFLATPGDYSAADFEPAKPDRKRGSCKRNEAEK